MMGRESSCAADIAIAFPVCLAPCNLARCRTLQNESRLGAGSGHGGWRRRIVVAAPWPAVFQRVLCTLPSETNQTMPL